MGLFKKKEEKQTLESEVTEKILTSIKGLEPGSTEQKNAAEAYKTMKQAENDTVKTKQGWLSVLTGVGAGLGSLVLSYFMFKKPYDEAEKNIYVTNAIDKEAQKDGKSTVNNILRKVTRL